MRITEISNVLHDLKAKKIVFCLNEENIKGRLYQNTKLGLKLLEELKKAKIIINFQHHNPSPNENVIA